MKKLGVGNCKNAADQCRKWGLEAGNVIVGKVDYFDEKWSQSRLELLYIGKECCVWNVWKRNNDIQEFFYAGEHANWTLSCREWFLETESQTKGNK